jgi:hypothetical protein
MERRDFVRLNDATKTARELYDGMLALYPDRTNPGSLWMYEVAEIFLPDQNG